MSVIGRPTSAGVSVLFIIDEVPGPAQDSFFLTPSGMQGKKTYESEPDLSGEVMSNVQVSSHMGRFHVSITAQSAHARIAINVAPGIPSSIAMSATAAKVAPGQVVGITAKALDKFGNAVPGEFVAIMMEQYSGRPASLISETTLTDRNGEVTAQYQMSPVSGDKTLFTANNPNIGAFSISKVEVEVAGAPAAGASAPIAPPAAAPRAPQPPPPQSAFTAPPPEPAFTPPPMPDAAYATPETGAETPDQDVDEYLKTLEAANPYASPKFDIKRGKKPVMEISVLLPKIFTYAAILAFAAFLIFAGFSSYKFVIYQYFYTRGINNYNKESLGEALIAFEKANNMNPNRVEPLQFMAEIYIKQAITADDADNARRSEIEYSRALSVLDKALKINPNNIDVLYYLGEVYEGKHAYCEAINQYRKILNVDAKYESAISKITVLSGKCTR